MKSRVPVRWLQPIPEETLLKVPTLRDRVIRDALSVFCLEYNDLVNEINQKDLRTSDALSEASSTVFRFRCKMMDVQRSIGRFEVYKIWKAASEFLERKENEIERFVSSLRQRCLDAIDDEHEAKSAPSLLEPTAKSDPAPVDHANFYNPPTIDLSPLDLDIQAVNYFDGVKKRLQHGEKPTEHSLDLVIWSILQVKRQCFGSSEPYVTLQGFILGDVIRHGARPTGHTLDLAIAANCSYYTIKHIVDVFGDQLRPTPMSLDLAIENLERHNLAYFMARGATPTAHTLSLASKHDKEWAHDKGTFEMVALYIQYFANVRKYARVISQAVRHDNGSFAALPRDISLEIAVLAADGSSINHAIRTSTEGFFAHPPFQSCALISRNDIAIQASASKQMAQSYFSKPH